MYNQLSVGFNIFTTVFERALIVVIFKKNDCHNIMNYKPILQCTLLTKIEGSRKKSKFLLFFEGPHLCEKWSYRKFNKRISKLQTSPF